MTKEFCDLCEKETKNIHTVKLDHACYIKLGKSTTFSVCNNCLKNIENYITSQKISL